METEDRLLELLERFVQDKIDKDAFDEMFILLSALERSQIEAYLLDVLDQEEKCESFNFIDDRIEHLHSKILSNIVPEGNRKKKSKIKSLYWIAAAACVAFFLIAVPALFKTKIVDNELAEVVLAADVLPGTNKANIYLDDEEYALDGSQQGVLQDEAGLKYLDGTPILSTINKAKTIRISTPKGGQYQMILPDGTQVWVNAATELVYSSSFDISDRTVELIGEAYFDVADNNKLPFIVKSKNQEAIVTGTAFNVNAYLDESFIKTTLLEGELRVKTLKKELVLKPHEQVISDSSTDTFMKYTVDAITSTSWKDGVFDLHGISLDVCMRIIGRWYNLDIRYEDGIPDIILGGKMSRGVKLSTFLSFLQQNFEISAELYDNNTLMIKKNKKHVIL